MNLNHVDNTMIYSIHINYDRLTENEHFKRVKFDLESNERRLLPEDIEFKPGLNVIVGANGSGKSTLMDIINQYTLVDLFPKPEEYHNGHFDKMNLLQSLFGLFGKKGQYNNFIDIRADFNSPTFKMTEVKDKSNDAALSSFENFGLTYLSKHSSRGENLILSMQSFFKHVGENIKNKQGYSIESILDIIRNSSSTSEYETLIADYIEQHHIESEKASPTIIMDEPDNGLDIYNLSALSRMLIETVDDSKQFIVSLHNPALINVLRNNTNAHFIELTDGYLTAVSNFINSQPVPFAPPINQREKELKEQIENEPIQERIKKRKYTRD